MKKIGIRHKLFIFHVVVVLLVIFGMGASNYYDQIKTTRDIITQYHTDISRRFVTPISLAISGNNYANVTIPAFIKELVEIESLIYLEARGYSDRMNEYAITYNRSDKKVRRIKYEENYEEIIQSKINELNKHSLSAKVDSKKVSFLIDRAQDELLQFRQNIEALSHIRENFNLLMHSSVEPINSETWTLRVNLLTTNKNSGEITFVYDISGMRAIKERMLISGIYEVCLAIALSFPLLWLAGVVVVSPIESLTKYISKNLHEINPEKIPGLNKEDEIGYLAISFRDLLTKAKLYITKIEELGNTDDLTGLNNRRLYDAIINTLIIEARRSDQIVSYLYIDIDNFKKYNDNYGHNAGDVVLKKVAYCIKSSLSRESDYCFRFGGEEFLVILQTNTVIDSVMIAEKIRSNVENLNIAHKFNAGYGHITISIGVCSLSTCNQQTPDTIKNMVLSAADNELYTAKSAGRNRLSSTLIN